MIDPIERWERPPIVRSIIASNLMLSCNKEIACAVLLCAGMLLHSSTACKIKTKGGLRLSDGPLKAESSTHSQVSQLFHVGGVLIHSNFVVSVYISVMYRNPDTKDGPNDKDDPLSYPLWIVCTSGPVLMLTAFVHGALWWPYSPYIGAIVSSPTMEYTDFQPTCSTHAQEPTFVLDQTRGHLLQTNLGTRLCIFECM